MAIAKGAAKGAAAKKKALTFVVDCRCGGVLGCACIKAAA